VGVIQQVQHHHHRIGAEGVEGGERLQRLGGLAAHGHFEQGDGLGAVGQTQHVANLSGADSVALIGLDDGLIEQ
jgi:hypothetical protein